MKKRFVAFLSTLFVLGAVLGLSSPASAQITGELSAGLGITVVNLEKWYGGSVFDWNKMAYMGNAQVYFAGLGGLRIGAEAGYEYNFWYSVPSGYSWVYTYEVSDWYIGAVARKELPGNFFADFGAGVHFFSAGFSYAGIMGEGGYVFKLNEKISFPFKVRAQVILGNPIVVPIGVCAGVRVNL